MQAPRERGGLDEERLPAAEVALRRIGGHEGQGLDPAAEAPEEGGVTLIRRIADRNDAERAAVLRRVLAPRSLAEPVLAQRAEIDVRGDGRPLQREPLGRGEKLASLRDHAGP